MYMYIAWMQYKKKQVTYLHNIYIEINKLNLNIKMTLKK